jgi:hypothetical protein
MSKTRKRNSSRKTKIKGGYSQQQRNSLIALGFLPAFIDAMSSHNIGVGYLTSSLQGYLHDHPGTTVNHFMADILRETNIHIDDGFTDNEDTDSQDSQNGGKRKRKTRKNRRSIKNKRNKRNKRNI